MNIKKPVLVKAPALEIERIYIDKNFKVTVENFKSTDILTCKNGEITFKAGGILYNLTEKDIAILSSEKYEIEYLRGTPQLLRYKLSGFRYSGFNEGIIPHIEKETLALSENIPQTGEVLELIETEYANKLSDWKLSVTHLTDYLIILLERLALSLKGMVNEPDNLAEAVKDYVNINFGKNITLASLSEIFFVSPFHISHTFKENYGISPIQYLINVRMNEAKNLLLDTNFSIREIALKVGYPNANYFNILFKRFSGKSPGAFRKQKR